uniref:Uncharacterized protein n=1 Tax=Candidatus Kentrum sp. LFY TaxID=2126342 RepID=A0A450V399_9GAMM|nr:MAG: hypothetical protein BECKLFY1418A_GA0070994_10963 [Candidatus Kentron sp. LFY]
MSTFPALTGLCLITALLDPASMLCGYKVAIIFSAIPMADARLFPFIVARQLVSVCSQKSFGVVRSIEPESRPIFERACFVFSLYRRANHT